MPSKKSLDPYGEFAEFYDMYVGERLADLDLYLKYAKSVQSPVLEIGAGSRRLTIPLAREGVSLVAVDVSPAMLMKLKSRLDREPVTVQRRIEVVEADACQLDLARQFDLIIVPFYTFNYFVTQEEQTSMLHSMASHLGRHGRVLIDVFVPVTLLENCPTSSVLKVHQIDLESGNWLQGWNVYSFDREKQIESRLHVFETTKPDGSVQRREFITRRRYWFREQLRDFFEAHDFVIEKICAGYAEGPADDRAQQLMYTLRR